jgi:hypothetical protein
LQAGHGPEKGEARHQGILVKKFLFVVLLSLAMPVYGQTGECVVLLHGLARTSRSMDSLGEYLTSQGFTVINIDYPSREYPIEQLSVMIRKEVVSRTSGAGTVHFVTHSMGGIIVRTMQATDPLPTLGRVVMLSPPNQGSEVVDSLGGLWLFGSIHGPAGKQLGTRDEGIARKLGKVDFPLGVITGDRSVNWINSLIIPGMDDGKVSVERAKVDGMADYLVVHACHPLIMNHPAVQSQCVYFLRHGRFTRAGSGAP